MSHLDPVELVQHRQRRLADLRSRRAEMEAELFEYDGEIAHAEESVLEAITALAEFVVESHKNEGGRDARADRMLDGDAAAAYAVIDRLKGQKWNSSPRRQYYRLTAREVDALLKLLPMLRGIG